MAKYGWKCWLVIIVVSAWFITAASAQQAFPPVSAGVPNSGHTGASAKLRWSTQDRSQSAIPELVRLPKVEEISERHIAAVGRYPNTPSRSNALSNADAGDRIDGTWREEGPFLVLNLNGQQVRLVKEATSRAHTTVSPSGPSVAPLPGAGEVRGRLAHRGQPLVDCEVAIMPLRKSWLGYRYDRSAKLVSATTDPQGSYCFPQVPAGLYQLKWRPAGAESWIHHAETRPDVIVRAGKTTQVKPVRIALRTIN